VDSLLCVFWLRSSTGYDLLDDLHAGLADGTYARRLKGLGAPTLLIVDDAGLGQVKRRAEEPTAVHTLYNLVDRRHGHASTAVTSNIGLSDWGRYLGDAALTAAILDRLAMHAIRVDIQARAGASMSPRPAPPSALRRPEPGYWLAPERRPSAGSPDPSFHVLPTASVDPLCARPASTPRNARLFRPQPSGGMERIGRSANY
jgi:hypothetical protein